MTNTPNDDVDAAATKSHKHNTNDLRTELTINYDLYSKLKNLLIRKHNYDNADFIKNFNSDIDGLILLAINSLEERFTPSTSSLFGTKLRTDVGINLKKLAESLYYNGKYPNFHRNDLTLIITNTLGKIDARTLRKYLCYVEKASVPNTRTGKFNVELFCKSVM